MSALPADLTSTAGFVVADNRGKLVGRVECPMYGTLPDVPDALAVRAGRFSRRRRLVPADTIAQINALLNTDGASTLSYSDNTDTPSASTTLTLTSSRKTTITGLTPTGTYQFQVRALGKLGHNDWSSPMTFICA